MKMFFLMLTAAFFSFQAYSEDCKVKLSDISGSYEGDCKKGVAHGKGKSIGTDTYEGTFKKGLPDGEGTYTWANGDVYVGEFKKGLKSGPGKLTSEDGITSGFWADGEYIGKDEFPYKLLSADDKISDIQFKRKGGDKNQIVISYELLSRRAEHGKINVRTLQGNYASVIQDPYIKTIQQVNYPIRIQVDGGERFDIIINQPGEWEVKVKLTGN